MKSDAREGDSLPTMTGAGAPVTPSMDMRRTVRCRLVTNQPPTHTQQDRPIPSDLGGRLRGPFLQGERVQLTDVKKRHNTITLIVGEKFHTHRGWIEHDDIIGSHEGTVVRSTASNEYVCFRPQLRDLVLSMPRGATVIYPKDAASIVSLLDLSPGDRVLEAGVGSGAMSMSLLRAVGPQGHVHSFERRADFAVIARKNVHGFLGAAPHWTVTDGDLNEQWNELSLQHHTFDGVILDMLAPWECLDTAFEALRPGGTFVGYVATTTQMSMLIEGLRASERFREPVGEELMLRGWHVDGLAVRPAHRMNGHTGFLVSARAMATGHSPIRRHIRAPKDVGSADTAAPM